MARGFRIFKARYTVGGETRQSEKWYIEFTDHRGTSHRLPAYRSMVETSSRGQRQRDLGFESTEELGRRLRLVALRRDREPMPADLGRWIGEKMPARTRARLAKWGILEPGGYRGHENPRGPYRRRRRGAGMETAPRGQGQYREVRSPDDRAREAPLRCLPVHLLERYQRQRAHGVAQGDARRRQGKRVHEQHALDGREVILRVDGTRRARRRLAAGPPSRASMPARRSRASAGRFRFEEIRWLLDATRRGPERAGMGGEERALLYRLVIETGLRSNEVASLTRGSFDLEARTVTVSAADSKHRREDVLPIRADMAAALEGFLRLKAPAAKAFGMTRNRPMSEAVKADLRSARAAYLKAASAPQERRQRARTSFCAYKDGSGRVFDFHGLRHTAGSL